MGGANRDFWATMRPTMKELKAILLRSTNTAVKKVCVAADVRRRKFAPGLGCAV
jgi:hypothetical protein